MSGFDPYAAEARFAGSLFDREAEGGRVRAELRLTTEGIEAETSDGRRALLPWRRVRFERGGASGDMVFCHGTGRLPTVACEHPDFLRAVEGLGGNEVADAVARLTGERVSRRNRGLLTCSLALLLVAGTVVLVPRMFRGTVHAVVDALPFTIDRRIGSAVSSTMDPGGAEVTDADVRGAVEAILDRLAPHAGLPEGAELSFRVVANDQVNAYALPGGYLTIYTGLLARAERAEMVAGVLAHEIAHVTLRHGLRRITHAIGVFSVVRLLAGDVEGVIAIATELFTLASVNDYSRGQESEADRVGLETLVAARVDPAGLLEFFDELGDAADLPGGLGWLSTHPETGARVAEIERALEKIPAARAYRDLEVDWPAVRERVDASGTRNR